MSGDILNARHRIAAAAGGISQCAAQVARALAWQSGDEAMAIDDLETSVAAMQKVERQLVDAINELRIATKK